MALHDLGPHTALYIAHSHNCMSFSLGHGQQDTPASFQH